MVNVVTNTTYTRKLLSGTQFFFEPFPPLLFSKSIPSKRGVANPSEIICAATKYKLIEFVKNVLSFLAGESLRKSPRPQKRSPLQQNGGRTTWNLQFEIRIEF